MKRLLLFVLAAFVSVAPALAADTGLADLSMYVALGDSLTAGYSSGSLVVTYQEYSFPAILAEQAGIEDFQQPLVAEPGMPPMLVLQHLVPDPVIVPVSETTGYPMNAELARPYNNLGVPGANLYDLLNTVGDINNLLAGNTDNVMHDLILRDGQHTAIEQAISLSPTFITLWIGNNDILGAAVYATPVEGVTMTPVETFQTLYEQAVATLSQYTDAEMVLFTLPDVVVIPFVTTLKPYIELPDGTHVPLIGSNGPLTEDCYVTLYASELLAQGIGIPTELGGTGQPLPEDMQLVGSEVIPGVVLRPEEVAIIQERINTFNAIIKGIAEEYGAKVLDINDILNRVKEGYFVYGGFQLSTDFLIGGVFSYDGVHPQRVGYALVASQLIDLINREYRAHIPQINLYDILVNPEAGSAEAASVEAQKVTFSSEAMKALTKAFPLLKDPRMGLELAPEITGTPSLSLGN